MCSIPVLYMLGKYRKDFHKIYIYIYIYICMYIYKEKESVCVCPFSNYYAFIFKQI